MIKFDLKKYERAIESGDVVSTFKSLKALYKILDDNLCTLALEADDSTESVNLQTRRLEQKESLIKLANDIPCRDVFEISQKIDFLNLVHLKEISPHDLSDAERLTQSIWEDCQGFL